MVEITYERRYYHHLCVLACISTYTTNTTWSHVSDYFEKCLGDQNQITTFNVGS